MIADFSERLKHKIANTKLIRKNKVKFMISFVNSKKTKAQGTNNNSPISMILQLDLNFLLYFFEKKAKAISISKI